MAERSPAGKVRPQFLSTKQKPEKRSAGNPDLLVSQPNVAPPLPARKARLKFPTKSLKEQKTADCVSPQQRLMQMGFDIAHGRVLNPLEEYSRGVREAVIALRKFRKQIEARNRRRGLPGLLDSLLFEIHESEFLKLGAVPRRGPGAPTKYEKETLDQAQKLNKTGLSWTKVALRMGFSDPKKAGISLRTAVAYREKKKAKKS